MAGRRALTRRTWPQRLLITLNVSVIVACLVAAGGLGYLNFKLDQVPRIDLAAELTDEPVDPGEPQNYLLVGTDSAAGLAEDDPRTNGRENLGVLSDTIMLLRVDPGSTQAQLLSFPRDLWVTIPGAGEQKINAALSAGGAETLINTITDNFGVPVHHYVEVDWLGFQNLVEAVDGVPMYFDKPLRDQTTGLNIPHAGCVTLDPVQALAFARSRHLEYSEDGGATYAVDGTGDLGRISRQQAFLRRAIQRAIDKGVRNPITLNSLVNVGVDAVGALDTELTADDLITLGTAFRSFQPDQLQTMTLDVSDDFVNGQSILRLQDTEANQARIDIFKGLGGGAGGEAGSVRVAINNGTGAVGQATEVADRLAALGFDTSPGTGDAEGFDFTRTVVRYQAGNEAAAQYIAAQLVNGADLQEVGATYVADVIVVTGTDYAGVEASLQPPPTPLGGSGGGTVPATTPAGPGPGSVTSTTYAYGEVPSTPPDQVCG
jgi:LCP family protein required for cell wall assembly